MNYFLSIILCVLSSELLAASLDLDTMEQSFFVEAKRIHISGYPDAFNPSIVKWKNQILMSFRSREIEEGPANLVGFVWLNEQLDPIGSPTLLQNPSQESSYIQDPRLFVIKDKLYMAYSDLLINPVTLTKKRTMCVGELDYDGKRFFLTNRDCYYDFDGDTNNKFEKNWVPFVYQDILLLAYSIAPHKVFLPLIGEDRCVTIAQTCPINRWSWGILRGGTTALPIDKNHYLAFFHSSIPIATVQSYHKTILHYFMGAYLFESNPPFSIKKISREPIVSKYFYNGPSYPTWKPLNVIFPCGFIYDNNYIWISYGRQDFEAWIVKIDKAELLKSLIPVESNF